jgi:hypothetical protein
VKLRAARQQLAIAATKSSSTSRSARRQQTSVVSADVSAANRIVMF